MLISTGSQQLVSSLVPPTPVQPLNYPQMAARAVVLAHHKPAPWIRPAVAPIVGGRAFGYSTNFDGTENPISESGAWTQLGASWTKVRTSGGLAYGTQGTLGGFDDSYAYLSGFAANHYASAVIAKTGSAAGGMEVELLLRWLDTSSTARGYECNLHRNGDYAEIVRWNGALGDFEVITSVTTITAPADGDTFYASIVGNIVTLKINGTTILTGDITSIGGTVYSTGNPGLGFFRADDGALPINYGYTSFQAGNL